MNIRFCAPFVAAAAVASAFADTYRHSIGIGVLDIVNVKMTGSIVASPDPSLAPLSNRDYVDGFNRVDSSGNLGEGAPGLASRTSNFGFTNNQQVDLQRGTLALHALSPGESRYLSRSSLHGDPAPELRYRIVRERAGAMTLGVEFRAGRLDIDYSSSDPLAGSVRVVTDTYALGGVVPQPAPYSGSFTVQPGTQRIGDTPARSVSTAAATIQGQREFSAKGWLLRLGLVWQPLQTSRLALQFHGGPAMMNAKGAFRLNERWISGGLPTLPHATNGSSREWLVGGYAGFSGNLHLTGRWDAFAGADFLHADTLSIASIGGGAKFDFSRSVLISAGLGFRF